MSQKMVLLGGTEDEAQYFLNRFKFSTALYSYRALKRTRWTT